MKWIAEHFYSPVVPWRLLGGLFLSVILFVIYYTWQFSATTPSTQPDPAAYTLMVVSIFYALGLTLLCFKGIQRNKHKPGLRSYTRKGLCLSPILLGLVVGVFTLGQVFWLFQTLIIGRVLSYPDPSEYVLFGMYPCLMGAILLLPAPNLSWLARARIFLDGLLIMVAVATLCYYFVLAPLLVHSGGTLQAKVASAIFISLDLVMMFCLLLVVLRSGDRRLRPVLILLGCSIFILFLTHTLRTYELLYKGWYNYFSLVAIGWPIAGIFLVGSAQTINVILKRGEAAEQVPRGQPARTEMVFSARRWKAALPTLLVLVVSVIVFATWLTGGIETFMGQRIIVYGGGFAILTLMILRQLLTLYQVNALQRQLQVKNRSLSMLNTHLEAQVTRDALTGLPNHRTVVEKLDEALKKARATNGNCSVIFMDIDDFKSINDRYGHLTGDTVLTNFSTVVRSGLRPGDDIGRWGGEEFVVILPDTEPLEALNLAEGLRKRIDQHVLAGNGEIHVTCSLGVACYPQDANEREDLIRQADQAMYAAKELGRNQTRTAHEPLVQAMNVAEAEPELVPEREALTSAEALLAALEVRDLLTAQHMRRVAVLALKLALALGLSGREAQLVSLGGLLHDLGKLAVPDTILSKRGRLNEAERALILQHPVVGATILQSIPALQAVAPLVRGHHEQVNGCGYPDGLRGDAIPLGARIVTVADVYDAMTSERSYHLASSSTEALQILQNEAGSHFDPRVVETLASLLTTSSSLSDVA